MWNWYKSCFFILTCKNNAVRFPTSIGAGRGADAGGCHFVTMLGPAGGDGPNVLELTTVRSKSGGHMILELRRHDFRSKLEKNLLPSGGLECSPSLMFAINWGGRRVLGSIPLAKALILKSN